MAVDELNTPGKRLRALRKAKELTQVTLAKLAGIDQSTLSDYERDKAKIAGPALAALAAHLEVTMEHIQGGEPVEVDADAELLSIYARLNADGRERLLDSARGLAAQGKFIRRDAPPKPDAQETAKAA